VPIAQKLVYLPDMTDLEVELDDGPGIFRTRVLRATRVLLAEKGLGVSMDDIAAAAGVGRRSLFRHFDNRDALVAAALRSSLSWYGERLVDEVDSHVPLDAWLLDVVRRVHELHLGAGRALWQLASSFDDDLPPEVAAVNRYRRAARRRWTQQFAEEAWARGNNPAPVPDEVVDAVALALSSFATHSMTYDLKRKLEPLTRHTAAMLEAVITGIRR
jgi:AcrR family transcriptional regulator